VAVVVYYDHYMIVVVAVVAVGKRYAEAGVAFLSYDALNHGLSDSRDDADRGYIEDFTHLVRRPPPFTIARRGNAALSRPVAHPVLSTDLTRTLRSPTIVGGRPHGFCERGTRRASGEIPHATYVSSRPQ
jgi:hypothetical protein